jgi:hypothetical protein
VVDDRVLVLDQALPGKATAIRAADLLTLGKEESRSLIRDYDVVYVYHNQVDAVGDSASTEEHTFDAVRKAIEELGDLVGKIVNSLNGNHILITADHGFLFRLFSKICGCLLARVERQVYETRRFPSRGRRESRRLF